MPRTPDYTTAWGLPKPKSSNYIAGANDNLRLDIRNLADKTDQSLTQVNTVATDAHDMAEDATWDKGLISASAHLDNLVEPGLYNQASTGAADPARGFPIQKRGSLWVSSLSNDVKQQMYITEEGAFVREWSSNVWRDWISLSGSGGSSALPVRAISSAEHLDDLQEHGIYLQGSTGTATEDRGFPTQKRGNLYVLRMTASIVQQMYVTELGLYVRELDDLGWRGWTSLGRGGGDVEFPETIDYGTERLVRISEMRRRLGNISTGGKGAVALVYDHGAQRFQDTVLPALQARGLKATLAMSSARLDPSHIYYHHESSVPWSTIKSWHDNDGIEIANHSRTHLGARDAIEAYEEIVVGREELETYIDAPVDSWVHHSQHGGNEYDYDGLGIGDDPVLWYEKTPGKMIIGAHPVVLGNIQPPSRTYPINGEPPIGWRGVWADHGDHRIDPVHTALQRAAEHGERVFIRCHPQNIDGSGDGTITTPQFHDLLDLVKSYVDAGDLVSLTLREWAIATH